MPERKVRQTSSQNIQVRDPFLKEYLVPILLQNVGIKPQLDCPTQSENFERQRIYSDVIYCTKAPEFQLTSQPIELIDKKICDVKTTASNLSS